eukprot:COSAG05_NODE_1910_length_3845_cov_2.662306_6_plen_56_part_00
MNRLQVPLFAPLDEHQRGKMADAMEEVVYKPGDAIIREGELGSAMYLPPATKSLY